MNERYFDAGKREEKNRKSSIIERLAQLTQTLGRRISYTKKDVIFDLVVIGVAGIYVGGQIVNQLRQQPPTMAVERISSLTQIYQPQPENSSPLLSKVDIIREHMARYPEFNKKNFWNIATTEPVQLFGMIDTKIDLLNLPDSQLGQTVKSKAVKVNQDKPLQGIHTELTVVMDKQTQAISVWADLISKEDTSERLQVGMFEVYNGSWLFKFQNEEGAAIGKFISGEEVLSQASPPFFFPNEIKSTTF